MRTLVIIPLLVSSIFGKEMGPKGGVWREEANLFHQGKQSGLNQHLKGDPGIGPMEFPQRFRRDSSQNQAQISPSSGTSPFAPPVQTSYFLGQCLMCPPGGPGPRGPPGLPGRDGRDGRDQALLTWPKDHEKNPNTEEEQEVPVVTNYTGVTYPRWGKTTCPPSSEIVYEGVMAGGKYNEKGGGANYLCLALEPIFDHPVAGNNFGAYIYGTEYEFNALTEMPNIFQQDVPCVVCLARSKQNVLMVPGRNRCPAQQGWTLEYKGFLMADSAEQARSEYICIDKTAEGIPRTNSNDNHAIVRPVEAQCGNSGGGLPCPPYVSGYEVTCAVCTL